jgi:hypothetical protein
MLHKCANPACSVSFRNLGRGKLFRMESHARSLPNQRTRPRRVERYWLCDICSLSLTLAYDCRLGVATLPLPGPVGRLAVGTRA